MRTWDNDIVQSTKLQNDDIKSAHRYREREKVDTRNEITLRSRERGLTILAISDFCEVSGALKRAVLRRRGLSLLLGFLREENRLDVGQHTTLGDGDAGQEFVQLLVVANGEL